MRTRRPLPKIHVIRGSFNLGNYSSSYSLLWITMVPLLGEPIV